MSISPEETFLPHRNFRYHDAIVMPPSRAAGAGLTGKRRSPHHIDWPGDKGSKTVPNDMKTHTPSKTEGDRSAESVDRAPSAEPTREGHGGLPVDEADEPRGQPTSDRFRSEQAHKA
jgi:hypothetical protein